MQRSHHDVASLSPVSCCDTQVLALFRPCCTLRSLVAECGHTKARPCYCLGLGLIPTFLNWRLFRRIHPESATVPSYCLSILTNRNLNTSSALKHKTQKEINPKKPQFTHYINAHHIQYKHDIHIYIHYMHI